MERGSDLSEDLMVQNNVKQHMGTDRVTQEHNNVIQLLETCSD